MICPKCEFEQPDGRAECLRCGVVFAKVREAGASEKPPASRLDATLPEIYDETVHERAPAAVAASVELPPPSGLDRQGRIALGVGFGLSVVVLAIPFARFVLSYLGVLVHELGHSVVSWIFGYPAVPAFDFSYGGGVSVSFDRNGGLVMTILALWGFLFWSYRKYPRLLGLLAAVFGLWAVLAWTPLHEALGIAMGHGTELVFAGIFLYRAAGGSGCKMPEIERPLYSMIGWFLVLEQTWFAWGLVTDPGKRQLYADAKGGGHWMDFSRLARDYAHVSLETVAGAFLLCCVLTPAAAWAFLRYRKTVMHRLEGWLAR